MESAGGWAGKCHIIRSNGSLLRANINDTVTIENVRDNWSKVLDMKSAQHLDSIQEATGALLTSLEQLRSSLPEYESNSEKYPLTDNAFILYALGGK